MRGWLIIASLLCMAPLSAAADPDPWLGRDKALHFGVSAGLSGGGYAAGAMIWDEPLPALLTGAGLALGAGAAKELWDLAGNGHPSWRDMAWNVVGAGAGLLVAWSIHALLQPERPPSGGAAAGGQAALLSLRW